MQPHWQQMQQAQQAQIQHHRVEQMQGAAWAEAQRQRAGIYGQGGYGSNPSTAGSIIDSIVTLIVYGFFLLIAWFVIMAFLGNQ